MKYKTIGILGGMGPEATAELYFRIIRIFQNEYWAKFDDDFPEMILLNLPIPDVVENLKEEKKVEKMLVNGVKKLENAGADFIAIPCNTVTFFLSAMQESVSIPILSILKETADEIERLGVKKVGVVGTEITINKNMYGQVLKDVELIIPEVQSQKVTTRIIMNILAGKKNKEDQIFLQDLIYKLKIDGAEKVILGCTELPLLVKGNQDTVDTIEVLAKATVREAIKIARENLNKQQRTSEVKL